jgi:hypothetical protein
MPRRAVFERWSKPRGGLWSWLLSPWCRR